jgi:hypothetical protein
MIATTLTYEVRISYESEKALGASDREALETALRESIFEVEVYLAPIDRTIDTYASEVRLLR